MKPPGFTVRRLMIVVAILAVLFRGLVLWKRSSAYRYHVRYHRMQERSTFIRVTEGQYTASEAELAEMTKVWAAHHAALTRKYEQAWPWQNLPPDPPDPFPLSGPGRRVDVHFGD
jgi:Tfp pilus assembly protein PilE